VSPRPMLQDVFLHIGPVKTGSTYLQEILCANRDRLRPHGIEVPFRDPQEAWIAVNDLQDWKWTIDPPSQHAGSWSRLVDEVRQSGSRKVIVSQELLSFADRECVERVQADLAPANLHVVAMCRRLDLVLPSIYQEKIKMVDPPIAWLDWLEEQRREDSPLSDVDGMLQTWSAAVPRARQHLVSVPRETNDARLLLARFATAVGAEPSLFASHDMRVNVSLNTTQLALLHKLSAHWLAARRPGEVRELVRNTVVPMLAGLPGSVRKLPLQSEAWVTGMAHRRAARLQDLVSNGVNFHGDWQDLEPARSAFGETGDGDPDLVQVLAHVLERVHERCSVGGRAS
jgi:hypothetical protein